MQTAVQRRNAIQSATTEVRAYRNSQPIRLLVRLLDALMEEHCADLVLITPEALPHKQGAIRQLMSLRQALTQEHEPVCPKM